MEKNPLCRNMKDLHYGFNKINTSPWNFSNIQFCNKNVTGEKWDSDFLPKSTYTCSFCKREFKSAQALGGHMNVHRRDRARLRQCYSPQSDTPATCNNVIGQFPPMLNLNLDPNTKKFPNLPSKLPPIVTLTEKDNDAAVPFFTDLMNGKRLFRVEKNVQEKIVKKAVRLELEIGLISDSEEEVVDLELRLGYST